MARIVRGQTLALKRREFVGAAQALGLTDWQIIRRHIIPNTIGPVVVFVTVVVPKVILLESFPLLPRAWRAGAADELGSADFRRREQYPISPVAIDISGNLLRADPVLAQFCGRRVA